MQAQWRWTSSRNRQDAILSAMPVVAIALLVGLVGILLWYVDRNTAEDARTTLINDALWVEQTLRFQTSVDEDAIARLALDAGREDAVGPVFLDRARVLIANSPEVIAAVLFDRSGRVQAAIPGGDTAPVPMLEARERADFSARPVYGPVRRGGDGTVLVDVAAPVTGPEGRREGAVVVTLSLTALITRHVPWWIAEKYAVRLLDVSGAVLVEKARVEPLDPELGHTISFEPPIPGAALWISPYKRSVPAGPVLLLAAIGALALFAVISLVALQRHVTRRRAAEERLQTETAFRRAMETSLTVGMRARDMDGRIIYVNPAFCRMMGWSAGELVGAAPPMPYWLPDQIEETRARHDAQVKGELKAKSWETRFRRRDGVVFDALVYEAPLVDANGGVRGWLGSIIDISDRKAAAELARLQSETLQRTSRLVTLGEMASTLAHELNQPLAAIASYATGSLNMLKSGTADPGVLEEAMEKLGGQARRAGQIIRRIQDFVRKREPRFTTVSTAAVIEDTVAFAATDARNNGVRIVVRLAPDLPSVMADRILLEQVLLNLLRNGVEAMGKGGGPDHVVTVAAEGRGADVAITVADRGPGIDPIVADRLFEPFVSTKPEGMGMGLNICRSIMELHRGRLSHSPRPGGGTVFTITLPAASGVEVAA